MTILKFCRKTFLGMLEILTGLVLLAVLVLGGALWKLSAGPIDLTFAAERVKSALIAENSQTRIEFKSLIGEWPDRTGPIILGMSGVELIKDNEPVLKIPRLGVSVAVAPLLIGKIKPESIIVTNPDLKLYRGRQGDVHLLVTDEPAQKIAGKTAETKGITGTAGTTQAITFDQVVESFFKGGNLPDYPALKPLSQLQKVSVRDATIYVEDQKNEKKWVIPAVTFDLTRKTNSFSIDLSYTDGQTEDGQTEDGQTEDKQPLTSGINLSLKRNTGEGWIDLTGQISHINSATLTELAFPSLNLSGQKLVIDGTVTARMGNDWNINSLNAFLTSDQGNLDLDGITSAPLVVSDLAANVVYDETQGFLEIKDTRVKINGQDIGLSGQARLNDGQDYFPLTISVNELTFDQIQKFWPEHEKETVLGDWMTKRLSGATVKNLKLQLPVNLKNLQDMPSEKIEAAFDFENLKADYRAPLIPVEQAKGTATIKDDVLDIKVGSGKMADMTVHQAEISITKLTHASEIGDVTITTDLSGRLPTVLDYISREPINLGEKTGLKKETAKGSGDMNVVVSFPALADLPAEDVKVIVKAKLKDVLLPGIVKGLDISGGPFDLDVSGGQFTVSGKGKLDNKDIDLTYSEYINMEGAPYSSKIKANLVSDEKLRNHFGVNLTQFVSGDVPVDIDYLEPATGKIDIGIVADLTLARFFVEPIGYLKKQGVKGTATATARIRNNDISSVDDLVVRISDGTSASGKVIFGKVGKEWDVAEVSLPKVKIRKDADFAMTIKQRQKDVLDVAITGRQFDARAFLGGGDQKAEQKKLSRKERELSSRPVAGSGQDVAVNATVDVNRLKTGDEDDQFLTQPKIKVSTTAAGDISYLDVKGQTQNGLVTIALQPDISRKMVLDIKASNAGEMLYALDLYENLRGGKLHIRGEQTKGGGINDISGKGQIADFTVVKAPVLAKFINLFSLSGLTELLQNKGIEFSRLKTGFEWKQSGENRVINLKNGRTSGASIGLSFEGTVNQTYSTINLDGTVVPMSEVNGFFAKIPLLGSILGGSSGGLIAATYTMKGPTEDPTVFINPLSVLTPGFLRSMLFEGDTDFEDETSESPSQKNNAAEEMPRYNQ